MTLAVNSFIVLGCGAAGIAAGAFVHDRVSLFKRWLIPGPILGGLVLAAPTLLLRSAGVELNVDTTMQQLAMVGLFTSIGFNASREAVFKGGRPLALLLLMFWIGAMAQNAAGVGIARALGQHPLIGIAAGAVALAGGPATSLAIGPGLEQAGAQGATSAALAAAIVGILVAGLLTGSLGAALIRRDKLTPNLSTEHAEASIQPSRTRRGLLSTLVLYGLAMGLGNLLNTAANGLLSPWNATLPAYAGAMVMAALIRALASKFHVLAIDQEWNDTLGSVSLTWFIPLALWTLRYWELTRLGPPILAILVVQLPVTLLVAWIAYRLIGRTFDSAVMASAYFGFMFGTMANSLASMDELQKRFGPCRQAFLVVPVAGGVLSDFANLFAIVLSRLLFAQ